MSGNTVSAKDDAFLYHMISGKNGIFEYGNMFEYTLVSANLIRLADGFAQIQGRNYIIYPSETVDVEISSGTQSMYRYDLICLQFEKDSDVESMSIVCIEGEESDTTPVDPTLTQDDTLASGTTYQMPLYRVRLDGINVDGVDDLREYIPSLKKTIRFISEGDGYIEVEFDE